MLTIYIDADACPVKDEICRVARRYVMRVAVVANAPLRVPAIPLVENGDRTNYFLSKTTLILSSAGDVVNPRDPSASLASTEANSDACPVRGSAGSQGTSTS
jgi:uncharacterized protein YaiI (UPF0178 family)